MARQRNGLVLLLVLLGMGSPRISKASLVVSERQGNSSFECIASGRCVPCTRPQQQDEDVYHCGATNYYMPYKCVEVTTSANAGEDEGEDEDASSDRETTTLRGSVHNAKVHKGLLQQKEKEKAAAVPNIFHIYKSCVPPVPEDRLSVVGFEAILLVLLAIFSPVLYLRKKRGFVPSGMTRIPSTTRF